MGGVPCDGISTVPGTRWGVQKGVMLEIEKAALSLDGVLGPLYLS